MKATFADIVALGLTGPYNASKMKIRVVVDVNGAYHFSSHPGANFAKGYQLLDAGVADVSSKIAPCCLKRSSWKNLCPGRKSPFTVPASASGILKTRNGILSLLSQSAELKAKSADAIKIFLSIQKLHEHEAKGVENYVAENSPYSLGWAGAFKRNIKQERTRQVKLFRKQDVTPVLQQFADKLIREQDYASIDLDTIRAQKKAYAESIQKLVDDEVSYLVQLKDGYYHMPPWAQTSETIYRSKMEEFFALPAVIAEAFYKANLLSSFAKLEEPVDEKTLEALKVLYQPESDGPYSKLDAALAAARVL